MNSAKMQKHQAVIKEYESENLSITVDGVVGTCCLVTENQENFNSLSPPSYELEVI